tara:strand:+ start:1303 stop:1464 length:162 start_codon:yes stop_codon:yes gene_type:complete
MKIRINKHHNADLMLLAVVTIADSLVTLLTLAIVNPMWRADLMFSDWWENRNH